MAFALDAFFTAWFCLPSPSRRGHFPRGARQLHYGHLGRRPPPSSPAFLRHRSPRLRRARHAGAPALRAAAPAAGGLPPCCARGGSCRARAGGDQPVSRSFRRRRRCTPHYATLAVPFVIAAAAHGVAHVMAAAARRPRWGRGGVRAVVPAGLPTTQRRAGVFWCLRGATTGGLPRRSARLAALDTRWSTSSLGDFGGCARLPPSRTSPRA